MSKKNKAINQIPLWKQIFLYQNHFINELECINEMVQIVLPVLKTKDNEREKKLEELTEKIQEEDGEIVEAIKEVDIKEFLKNIKRLRHAETMFRQSIITSIVTKFDELVTSILKIAYEKNTNWLKNPEKKISYKDLLEIQSLDSLKNDIIEKEIDEIMRDSHFKQISFLDSKLKLGIEEHFKGWLEFLEITERRNIFVHTGGKVSSIYIENCKKWGIKINEDCKEGSYLNASDKYITETFDCFFELSIRLCQAFIRRTFPESFNESDEILNSIGYDLLCEERFQLADKIFDYALSIPSSLASGGEVKYYFLLNKCIALKNTGKDFSTILNSIDWSPFHPKFQFAVSILNDQFEKSKELMEQEAVYKEIDELSFIEWPLLKSFRKTDLFKDVFKKIYKKDFSDAIIEEVKYEITEQEKNDNDTKDECNNV
ncbi:MAG: hypothetical protein A2015_07565 [Spirochaetes bacterium GWF1_31_7]|nr:MAG: hypothetical protein A2Y30_01660 [Spirochaetes bacterium GWE1_32_154]OHD46901.1 MAG: hypothetical protein A2015_07565 [Spirochaetes bacterium GWF1_31_7]OHD48679.1 MAG: hypothetical protein A2Y29_13790 [Spirochaetes bacterium GWE2_31_10]HBD94905.1 hypothetical protein [Spirochaetia bacterium]HBI36894.1 hypothetical protein [Spirochaetia bacterium]